ncbi:hypothetical protein C8R46DRAFT_243707 [Mycena filopes]|nr:hypothetical protein C8R46DRAFT_243707 [Mycena filopes]
MSKTSELPGSPSPPANVRHWVEDLWFKDGTLVLFTEGCMFRVYGGLLAKQSSVFHNMLEFPQPDDAELIDGCPVVRVSDTDRDLSSFLSALFDYESFGAFPAATTFDTISGILRLSKKYEVDSLYKRALTHLSSASGDFPASSSWTLPHTEWIRVILLARELTLDWILPIAFYRVLENSTPSQLLQGIDIDGVHFELAPQDKSTAIVQLLAISRVACANVVHFLWDPTLMSGCHNTVPSFTPAQASALFGSPPVPVPMNGQTSPTCIAARLGARRKVEERRIAKCFPMDLWTEEDFNATALCAGCKAQMGAAHHSAADAFWTGLPERFGLPGWGVLRQMRDADLA